jgi:GDP-L-fucose synthase
MNTFVLESARKSGVERLLAFSSVCAFPGGIESFRESDLHSGPPFPAHGSYAHSKRMVDVQIESYRKQYGLQYCSVIPGNIFGENDNFNLADGHVVPSLIHKAYLAKESNQKLSVWGDGSAMREFIYVDDLSNICIELLKAKEIPQKIIVSGPEVSIKKMAEDIAKYAGLTGVEWDTTKPVGQLRRQTFSEVFDSMFPDYEFFDIEEGIKRTVEWFFKNYEESRK